MESGVGSSTQSPPDISNGDQAMAIAGFMNGIKPLLRKLQNSNGDIIRDLHEPPSCLSIPWHTTDPNISQAVMLARHIKRHLEVLDRAKIEDFERASSFLCLVWMELSTLRSQFEALRRSFMNKQKKSIESRYYTLTGRQANDHTIELFLKTGQYEAFRMQKADAIESRLEIEWTRRFVKKIEEQLLVLDEIFVDMFVFDAKMRSYQYRELFTRIRTEMITPIRCPIFESAMKSLLRMVMLLKEVKIWHNQCEYLLRKFRGGVHMVEQVSAWGKLVLPTVCKPVCLKYMCCILEGEALLLFCSESDKYGQASFALSSAPPSVPKFSRFAVVLRELDWTMDLFSCIMGCGIGINTSPEPWEWCADRCRLVYYGDTSKKKKKLGVLKDETLEADGSRQIADQEALRTSVKPKGNWFWTRSEPRDKFKAILRKRLLLSSHTPGSDLVPGCYWIENPVDFVHVDYITSGGFKTVAKSKWLGETVAVAIAINISRQQLVAEAGLLAKVQHPNVVELMGCAHKEDLNCSQGFIVTELMERDLPALIDLQLRRLGTGTTSENPPFDLPVAVDISLQIVEAMIHLKECGVIHQDLKPSHLLTSPKYQEYSQQAYDIDIPMYYSIKLTDFGTSKMRGQDSYFHTRKLGTASYMAPELYGRPEEQWPYTWSADVYSFGMACYTIFTGKAPFERSILRFIQIHL